jgi:hypothetical protein
MAAGGLDLVPVAPMPSRSHRIVAAVVLLPVLTMLARVISADHSRAPDSPPPASGIQIRMSSD